MRNALFVTLILVLVGLAALAAGCDITSPPSSNNGPGLGQNTGIAVSGEGEAIAVPDVATLTFGVEVQRDTVAQAQSEAAAAMNAINDALEANGVAERDIQTHQYYITPVWTYNRETGEQTLVGYRVTNTVTAKIRQVENTGEIIADVVAAGGDLTTVSGISFTVDDPSPYQEQARRSAVADARARAETLADAADVRLGDVIYITESGGAPPIRNVPVPGQGEAAPSPPPISPGEATITINVQVVYEIR